MTTQQIKDLREKLNNVPDDVIEKIADMISPVISPYEDQHIVDAFNEWNNECEYSKDEKKFMDVIDYDEVNRFPMAFYAGFKAAEKYHRRIK